jgi:hypothetical protein
MKIGTKFNESWGCFTQLRSNQLYLLLSVFFLILSFGAGGFFINLAENRIGLLVNDKVLNILPTIHCTFYIFVLEYLPIFLSLIWFMFYPEKLIVMVNTFSLIVVLRVITIFLFPLEPPNGIIPLFDPIIYAFTGKMQTKDLMFSGHVAFIVSLSLIHSNKWVKVLFILATIIMSFLLLLQKVHYTLDVIVALPFVYFAYQIAKRLAKNRKYLFN